MKLSQSSLQNIVLGVIGAVILVALFSSSFLRNSLLTGVFALGLLIIPFFSDSLTRFRAIPWLDSLNENSEHGRSEDFPLWLRVMIWVFVGLAIAYLWGYFVPYIFGLPLWLGKFAAGIGWKSLAANDGMWQYGWSLVFLVSYLLDFMVGWVATEYGDNSFEDRFNYPDQ